MSPLASRLSFVLALVLTGSFLLLASSEGLAQSGRSGTAHADRRAPLPFDLLRISVPEGSVWKINRPMEFTFSQEVDFNSVSLNTIDIQSLGGMPATGTFYLKEGNARKVVFQPTCPVESDLSDAGLQGGGIVYTITVPGLDIGVTNTVRSVNGDFLPTTKTRSFITPAGGTASDTFHDSVPGPPTPVIRAVGSFDFDASYLAIGGNDSVFDGIFFEFDVTTQTYSTSIPGFEVPLNLYADGDRDVAVVLVFNQSIAPSESNVNSDRLRLEYRDAVGAWTPIETRVSLVANCTPTGAVVKLEPIGILPPASEFRTVIRPGFTDLVGQAILLQIDNFGVVPTEPVAFTSLVPPDELADEILEEFLIGGDAPESLQDTGYPSQHAPARWTDGRLTAAVEFDGEGGPNGEFDWVIHTGEIQFFDTTAQAIVGGPGGLPTHVQNTVDGIVDVRNLIIEEGGYLKVQGPNPMTINATGEVIIRGTLDLSGFNAPNVATLNTGHIPEPGAPGAAGGGRGGTGSWVTNNSTPRGGRGFGAFDVLDGGGQGGESGYAPGGVDNRRPGGGGGGKFALVQFHQPDVGTAGFLRAHDGNDGHGTSTGAEANQSPAQGGASGPSPFVDGQASNNFYGTFPEVLGGTLSRLITGELNAIGAGAGGGAGGDAVPGTSFPHPNWSVATDEKGGAGGGGGGALQVRALGWIIFGHAGTILCEGGMGATGENTIFLDHVGGSGGSGSGGHVILETASKIDFTDGDPFAPVRTYISAAGGPQVIGNTDYGPSIAQGWSFGGEGGPGVIQLHVPDPILPPSFDPGFTDIVVPTASVPLPFPLHSVTLPGALVMVPHFGARSQAHSKWITIGGADQDPGGGEDLVSFAFRGTELSAPGDEGRILATDGVVDELPPLLSGTLTGSSTVTIDADGLTLRFAGASLAPLAGTFEDLYLRTPALLKNFRLRLAEGGAGGRFRAFDVTHAAYDDAAGVLTVGVNGTLGTLSDFVALMSGPVSYELLPLFFRVRTGDYLDRLPEGSSVKITFDATIEDAFGNPDEAWALANPQVQNVYDITDFQTLLAPGELKYFRFHVDFDLDPLGSGLGPDTEPVSLEFLRIPFRF